MWTETPDPGYYWHRWTAPGYPKGASLVQIFDQGSTRMSRSIEGGIAIPLESCHGVYYGPLTAPALREGNG